MSCDDNDLDFDTNTNDSTLKGILVIHHNHDSLGLCWRMYVQEAVVNYV
jgi:hypothetical protein